MTRDQQILDLLANWAESRDRGGAVAVAELCRQQPELAGELQSRIEMLDAMRWLDDQRDEESEDDELSLPDYSTLVRLRDETRFDEVRLSRVEFEHSLTTSGLVSPGELQKVVAELGASSTASSAELARALVLRGKLTPFQAHTVASGKASELVLGNYVILDKIGQGGMGQVFKARHRRMKRVVAIKVLPPATMNSAYAVERFHREVEAAARLEHPNIVTSHDADEAGGRHFLAMQYVEGRDLATLVRSVGPLSVGQAVSVLLQSAAGLAYAHGQGIIHRDIKPGNLLVDRSGTLKILDLGLARMQAEAGQDSSGAELTADGTVMGTVDYMAPEQAVDTHSADARADIYSLGCTLYYLLTGTPMYGGNSLMAKMLAHREQPIPDLAAARPDVPACLSQIFTRMVAKQPDQRPTSMTALLDELQQCAELSEALALPAHWEATGNNDSSAAKSAFEPIILRDSRDTTSSRIEETIDLPDSQADALPSATPASATPAPAQPVEPVLSQVDPLPVPSEGDQTESLLSRIRRRPLVATAVGLALAGMILLAGIVYRIQTDRGTIVVEIDDDTIAAKLQKDGLVIEDAANKRTWKLMAKTPEKLPTGEYKLAAPEGLKLHVTDDTGTEFDTGEFTIKRGDKVIVRVTAEPLAVAANISPKPAESVDPSQPAATPMPVGSTSDTPRAEETPSVTDPDRLAAEWVQRQKGDLGLKLSDGSLVLVTHEKPLPSEPFVVDNFNLGRLQPPESDWSPLSGLRHLRELRIFNAPATIPYAALKDVQSLQDLRLIQFQDDDVLDGIEAIPHLPKVWLTGTVNEAHIASLAKHPNLRRLALEHTSHLPAEVYEDLKKLPALEELHLACPLHTEDFPNLARLTQLKRLEIGHAMWVPDRLLDLKSLGNLEYLTLVMVDAVKPPISELALAMPRLETLNLAYSPKLSPDVLAGLGSHPRLSILKFEGTPISDAWLKELESWPRLRELHLSGESTTIAAQRQLLRKAPKLTIHLSYLGVRSYWNSRTELEGPVLYPKPLPEINRWQLTTTFPQRVSSHCAYSPDGKLLALACDRSSLVRVYDADSLQLRSVFELGDTSHYVRVPYVGFTADSRQLVAHRSGMFQVIPLDGSRPRTIQGVAAHVFAIDPREDWVALGDHLSGKIYLRSFDGNEGPICEGPMGMVAGIAWHPRGELLASSAGTNKSVQIWNRQGALQRTVELPSPLANWTHQPNLTWKPDGSLLAAACADGNTYLFNAEGVRIVDVPLGPPLAWHPKEDLLYGQCYSPVIGYVGYASTGKSVDVFGYHHSVTSSAWHPSGQRLATATKGGVGIETRAEQGWNSDWKSLQHLGDWPNYNPNAIDWSADRKSVLLNFGHNLLSWRADGQDAKSLQQLPVGKWFQGVASHPAQPELTTFSDGETQIRSPDGERLRTIRGTQWMGGTPSYSPSGEWMILATAEGDLRFFSANGRRGPVLEGAKLGEAVIAWSHDSQRVVVAVIGQPAGIWNLDGTAGPKLAVPTLGRVYGAAWSPDGKRLALSGDGLLLGLYNLETSQLEDPLPENQLGSALANLRWQAGVISGVSYNAHSYPHRDGLRRWSEEGRDLGSFPIPPGVLHTARSEPGGDRTAIGYSDGRYLVFDGEGVPQFVGMPLQLEGEWISLAPDGTVLGKSQEAAKYLRYLVEHSDGRFETITFDEFHQRTGGVLLQPAAAAEAGASNDAARAAPPESSLDRSAAKWALTLGAKVELFVSDEFRELASAGELPLDGTIRLQAIELPEGATISDSHLNALARIKSLKTLGCYGTNLTDAAGPHLAQLASLEQLGLGKTQVSDAILEHVAELPKLTHLRLGETQISDAGLKHLESCKSLQEIDLRGSKATAGGIAALQQAIPACKVVGM